LALTQCKVTQIHHLSSSCLSVLVSITACNSSKTIERTFTKCFIGEFINALKLWLKLDKVRDTFHKLLRAFQARLVMIFTAAQTLTTKICLTARNIVTCGENFNTHFVHDISYLNVAVLRISQEYLVSKPHCYSVSIFYNILYIKINIFNLLVSIPMTPFVNALLYFYFPVLCSAVFFKPSTETSYPSLSKPVWFKPAKSCNPYYVLQILCRCIQH